MYDSSGRLLQAHQSIPGASQRSVCWKQDPDGRRPWSQAMLIAAAQVMTIKFPTTRPLSLSSNNRLHATKRTVKHGMPERSGAWAL